MYVGKNGDDFAVARSLSARMAMDFDCEEGGERKGAHFFCFVFSARRGTGYYQVVTNGLLRSSPPPRR
jgi:hypothetical protein